MNAEYNLFTVFVVLISLHSAVDPIVFFIVYRKKWRTRKSSRRLAFRFDQVLSNGTAKADLGTNIEMTSIPSGSNIPNSWSNIDFDILSQGIFYNKSESHERKGISFQQKQQQQQSDMEPLHVTSNSDNRQPTTITGTFLVVLILSFSLFVFPFNNPKEMSLGNIIWMEDALGMSFKKILKTNEKRSSKPPL